MLPPGIDEGAPESERILFSLLSDCPDDWTVLHSVGWVAETGGRNINGEADFVVLLPERGVLVLEAKGGEYRVKEGQWFRRRSRTPMRRSPFQQVEDSRYRLRRFFRRRLGIEPPFGHAVVFTDAAPRGDLGLAAPDFAFVTPRDFTQLGQRLLDIASQWKLRGPLSRPDVVAVLELLAPTASVTLARRERSEVTSKMIERATVRQVLLTESQLAALRSFTRQDRAIIYGAAGTGKTVLAIRTALSLAEGGNNVLLVCHRARLARHIRESLRNSNAQGAIAVTHRAAAGQWFARRLGRDRYSEWRSGGMQLKSFLSDEPTIARSLVMGGLVVDEAQDFDEVDYAFLLRLLSDPRRDAIYAFVDPFQQRRRSHTAWVPPFEAPSVVLTQNCRNTKQVLSVSDRIGGREPGTTDLSGLAPKFKKVRRRRTAQAAAQEVVDLLHAGFGPANIAVLALEGDVLEDIADGLARRSVFSGGVYIEDIPFTRLHSSASSGFRTNPEGAVQLATIAAYHGLERDAVIIVLTNDGVKNYLRERDEASLRRDLYIAFTRARTTLVVFAERDRAAAWLESARAANRSHAGRQSRKRSRPATRQ